jgi:hypothetical protein
VFERFTDRARRVLVLAQEEARLLNHNFIGTEHILLGLIHEDDGVAAIALRSLGIGLEAAREKVEETIGPAGSATTATPPFTHRAKYVLELSLREALRLGHNYVGTEHLLLGLLREGEGVAVQVLVNLGADLSGVRQEVIHILSGLPAGGAASGGPVATFGEAGVDESVMAGPAGSVPSRSPGPRCPSCRALLDGQVAYRVLTVALVGPDLGVGPLEVAFVYCLRCGVTIAPTPTGPEDSPLGPPTIIPPTTVGGPPEPLWRAHPQPTRPTASPEASGGGDLGVDGPPLAAQVPVLRPSPPVAREFPQKLWDAIRPVEVAPTTVVDVRHTGRFREDGSIRGTVAGSSIDLALEFPRSASSASGSLDDAPVNVTWSLSNNSTGDPELPATLQGTVGAKPVNLQGVFRLGPGFWFDGASIEGTLADADLAASIERAFGAFGSSDTIVATGTLGDQTFEVFAAVDGPLERGVVRGTYDGQPVHLDLTATQGGDAHVTGTCPSPPSFALLLIASLVFFV